MYNSIKTDWFIFQPKSWSPNYSPSKRTKVPKPEPLPPSHLRVFLETRGRCESCSVAAKNITFIASSFCNATLCVQKERNCFLEYHSQNKTLSIFCTFYVELLFSWFQKFVIFTGFMTKCVFILSFLESVLWDWFQEKLLIFLPFSTPAGHQPPG